MKSWVCEAVNPVRRRDYVPAKRRLLQLLENKLELQELSQRRRNFATASVRVRTCNFS